MSLIRIEIRNLMITRPVEHKCGGECKAGAREVSERNDFRKFNMSALGPKRTSCIIREMSNRAPTADILARFQMGLLTEFRF